jgi:hypothetical protein
MNLAWWSEHPFEFPLLLLTAVVTHLLMSFSQTLMHYVLGHRRLGGMFFRNHIHYHHVNYSKDHLVSLAYIKNHDDGNNTPFFMIPTREAALVFAQAHANQDSGRHVNAPHRLAAGEDKVGGVHSQCGERSLHDHVLTGRFSIQKSRQANNALRSDHSGLNTLSIDQTLVANSAALPSYPPQRASARPKVPARAGFAEMSTREQTTNFEFATSVTLLFESDSSDAVFLIYLRRVCPAIYGFLPKVLCRDPNPDKAPSPSISFPL